MIARLKANKALLKKKDYFIKGTLRFKKGKKLRFKTVTNQELDEIKKQLWIRSKKDKRRTSLLSILTIFLASGVIWILIKIVQNLG